MNTVAPSLEVLIQELRDALGMESWIEKLHGRGPAETSNQELDAKGWVRSPDEGGIGRPFSGAMWRLLGSPDDWGSAYLARASLQELSDHCHARHMNHQRPGDRLSLCARLAFRVVELQQPIGHAAFMLGLDPDKTPDLLGNGLLHAKRWREARLNNLRQAAKVEASAGITVEEQFVRDHQDYDWERQKWDGIREAYHLPPWDIEWERRLGLHAKYNCARCERVAA